VNKALTKKLLSTFLIVSIFVISYKVVVHINNSISLNKNATSTIEIIDISYLIDFESTIDHKNISAYDNQFVKSENGNVPYQLGEHRYWVRLNIKGKSNKTKDWVIYVDNSMLTEFGVFSKKGKELVKLHTTMSNSFSLFNHVTSKAYLNEEKTIYIQVKSHGAPHIPFFITSKSNYESTVISSTVLYAIFIAVIVIMSLYNLVIYFAVKDEVYLYYVSYLLFTFLALSSVNGYARLLFDSSTINFIHTHFLLLHYFLILSLLGFTLQFLQYFKENSVLKAFSSSYIIVLIAIAFISQFLSVEHQTNLYFTVLALSYALILTLIFHKFSSTYAWARFYYISWIPLVIGGIIQPLTLTGKLEYNVFSSNAFLIAVFIEICFMSFALAERMKRNEFDRIKDVTYHASSGLPRKTNIESTLSHLINSKHDDFAIVIIKPEQIDRISLYIDDAANTTLFQNIYQKLSTLFSYNDAILPLTNAQEKLCFINNNSLAILVDEKNSNISLEQLVSSIQEFVNESFVVEDVQLPLSALVGISRYPEHGQYAHQLINHAQLALTQASHQLQKSAIYEQAASSKSTGHLQLAADLKQAIVNNELSIYHQPQIDLKTQRVCSSECLLRWKHPKEGMISPEIFISIAEDTGLINELTFWVIKQSLYQQNLIANENGFNHMLSINISGKDLVNPQFFVKAVELIELSGIAPEKIIFELTESLSFSANAKAVSVIEKLGEIGITVSIDDFGTGYSSMAQISGLPFQELKIDRQFVENITENEKHLIITEATIKMAKGMSLEVVAEGINSEQDERTLTDLGCDIGQGFYYAKPMPINEYLDWLHRLDNGKIPGPLIGDYLPAD